MRTWKAPIEGKYTTDVQFKFKAVTPTDKLDDGYFQDRMVLLYYPDDEKTRILRTFRLKPIETLVGREEIVQLYLATQDAAHLDGDMAEIGTYKGGTARIICEANPNKKLYVFDTFMGLPDIGKHDDKDKYKQGRFGSCYDEVATNLKGYNVELISGDFRETCDRIKDKKFSFVHIDVDLYDSTKFCLEFFYPRMVEGGIILSHDYQNNRGVNKAINEFFTGKETIVSLLGSQCLIVRGKV